MPHIAPGRVLVVFGTALTLSACVGTLNFDAAGDDSTPLVPDDVLPGEDVERAPPMLGGAPTCAADDPRDPGEPLMRRLTVEEYINSVGVAVGVDVAQSARDTLPVDIRADGFTNTAYNLRVDLAHVDAFATLAADAAERMDLDALLSTHTSCRELTEPCLDELVEGVGTWVLRGPPTDAEREAFVRLARAVEQEGAAFDEVARVMVEAMLQSPRFVFRIERQRGSGDVQRVSDWEMASRLSYMLWAGPPDAELHAAAAEGRLGTELEVRAQLERMMADPRAKQTTRRFAFEWLALSRLATLTPDADEFPEFVEGLQVDMLEETLTYVEHILWEPGRSMGDLYNAQLTFVTPRLATYYGMEDVQGPGLVQVDLSGEPTRGGLLTHASVLTVGGYEASMVGRGLFMLEDMLCGVVLDPPPGVDTTPKPAEPGLSQRMIAEERLEDSSCGGCHVQFEPLAFGLERYDGMGGYHDVDHFGNELRMDGELVFPGNPMKRPFVDTAELGELFARSERAQGCLTVKAVQYAIGRPLTSEDQCALEDIIEQTEDAGGSYPELLTAIATSPLTTTLRTEQ